MLTGLSIRNVVLIEALDLDFGAGLTALTGETGAGKSIILDSLGMATGARSDKGLVRSSADKAQCSASFDLPQGHGIVKSLLDAGIEIDDGEGLVLRRIINQDGRSRAFINDAPVGVKLLAEVGSALLEVHGQHDGRGLLDPSEHIHMLDMFGDCQAQIKACSAAFSSMRSLEASFNALKGKAQKSVEERDFLTFAIAELDRLDPREGEEEKLAQKRRFLQGAEGALAELSAAETALGETGIFEERLSAALSGIDRVRSKLGEGSSAAAVLENAAEALEKAILETQEARVAVSAAAEKFDVEPGELDAVEKRLFSLRAAARKYDVDVAALPDKRRIFAEELDAIDNVDRDLASAKAVAAKARAAFQAAAESLSAARKEAANLLDASVARELPPLKMERAQFKTLIESGVETALGQDKVRFLVSTNPGTAMGPLDKIASGGELARFALAIKVALAGKTSAVMVFDEVDQGVGGAVANAVGRRLARLALSAQVFVVTHSPQVAASADHQYLIQKSSNGLTTTTHVHRVADEEREEEIARMLAGETVTQEARAAARQLMQAS
ncbi:MAG: DNA repair protein RecN [Alphaproteobacteria bacterium]